MKRPSQLATLVVLLFLTGTGIFIFKWIFLDYPLTPQQTPTVWDLEIALKIQAEGGPIKIQTYIPTSQLPFLILDEQLISRGFGASTKKSYSNRRVVWSARDADGRHTLYYRARLQRVNATQQPEVEPPEQDKHPINLSPAQQEAARTVLEHASSLSADKETMIPILLRALDTTTPSPEVRAILGKKTSKLRKLSIAQTLLQQININAHILNTLSLNSGSSGKINQWLEVWDGEERQLYSVGGDQVELSNDIVLWRGTDSLVSISGAKLEQINYQTELSHAHYDQTHLEGAMLLSPVAWKLSLMSLPLQVQNVYKVLIMIPLGLLVLVVMRNFIGFKSFGTFMPVLIALAFRESGVMLGTVLLLVLISVGLLIRFYLSGLHLLLVPRQATIVVTIIVLMMLLSFLFFQSGFDSGLAVSIFPMIIIAMTIERMSIVWEERGATDAIQQLFGSLAISAITIWVISAPYLGHLFFVFPELVLCVSAILILSGRYRGYRLSELIRFRDLTLEAKDV